MRHTDVLGEPHGHTSCAQGIGITCSVIADRVVLGDLNQCRGQPAMVLGKQRRGQRIMSRFGRIAEIVTPISDHVGRREYRAVGVHPHR